MSVSIVRIPPAPDGSKQGIDDYLAAGGDLDDLEVLPFEGGWIPPRDWPTLAKDALQGLAGEVVNTIAPNTESDPVAILALFLAAYGNMIGRGAHFVVEGGQHFCKAWPVITGESGKGRKGSAQDRVNRLLKRVDEHWYYNCQAQGLSSGEGLIYHVRDRKTKEGKNGEPVVVDEGVVDKRLMLIEPEFAGPLTVHATGWEHPLRGTQDGLGRHHLADPHQELAGELHKEPRHRSGAHQQRGAPQTPHLREAGRRDRQPILLLVGEAV